MIKGHPKGLIVAFFANMGERFGYYTMLAIFTLYLQGKFGYTATQAGAIYGGFLFGVYFLPLLGGFLADNILGYGRTITIGIVIMFMGYSLLAWPGMGLGVVITALAIISLGTGLFKGNLQALVGNMYDDPRFSKNRDNAFNIFYMGINVGAFFAPSAAESIGNWILKGAGLVYDKRIPSLAHRFLDNTLEDTSQFLVLAKEQMGTAFTNLTDFSNHYIATLARSYNGAFAIAAGSMIVSLLVFVLFRKYYKSADLTEKQKEKSEEHRDKMIHLTPEQTRQRFFALGMVFFVVIFFWMSFHQNGFTLTIFARDYTVSEVSRMSYTWFNLKSLLPLIGGIIGLVMLLKRGLTTGFRFIGLGIVAIAGFLYWNTVSGYSDTMTISPQIFQQFNPLFIVFLTPLIVGFFTYLRKYNREPSAPRKIGIGMVLVAVGFGIMLLASMGLKSPAALQGAVSPDLISPYWLIGIYFTLTIAELFLSPIGISYVSKVAPPKHKGLMQGGWFAATAIGNLLAGLIGMFWDKWEMWQFFLLIVILCLMSAAFIFAVRKKLEKAASA